MKLLARLGELPSSQMPYFAINRRGKDEVKVPEVPQGPKFQKEEKRREKEAKKPPNRICNQFLHRSLVVLRLFFILHPVSVCASLFISFFDHR